MRGTILHFDETTGNGFITGEDDFRYRFSRTDISSATPPHSGMLVDFIPDDRAATQIFALPQQTTTPIAPPIVVEPELGLFDYFKRAMTRDFAKFSGRARRKEFWGFVLFVSLISLGLGTIIAIGLATSKVGLDEVPQLSPIAWLAVALYVVFGIGVLLPSIAITVRRFHDIGQSGWMYLLLVAISIIPFLGVLTSIVVLVMTCLDTQPGINKWGPPAKNGEYYTKA